MDSEPCGQSPGFSFPPPGSAPGFLQDSPKTKFDKTLDGLQALRDCGAYDEQSFQDSARDAGERLKDAMLGPRNPSLQELTAQATRFSAGSPDSAQVLLVGAKRRRQSQTEDTEPDADGLSSSLSEKFEEYKSLRGAQEVDFFAGLGMTGAPLVQQVS